MKNRQEYLKNYRKNNKDKIKKYFQDNKKRLTSYRKKYYTGLYGSWYAMKQRCGNPKNKSYKNYGGRGITYDKNWESFDGFKEDMGDSYKKGLTLDRIDNNASYSKENCRWATRKVQANNQRKNILIKYKGKTLTESQWAEELGLKTHTLMFRRIRGWPLARRMTGTLERSAKL